MNARFALMAAMFAAALLAAQKSQAQQVTTGTGLNRAGDSFTESIGTSWNLTGKNWYFNYGGAAANPQFGNHNPAAGVQSGFGFSRGDVQGNFDWWAGQGTERTYSGTSISGTMMNGEQLYVGDVAVSPFVVSVTPVVGGWYGSGPPPIGAHYATAMNVPSMRGNQTVREALERVRAAEAGAEHVTAENLHRAAVGSKPKRKIVQDAPVAGAEVEAVRKSVNRSTNPLAAETPALSVAEMRKVRAAELDRRHEEARELVKLGKNAEKEGNRALAKSYYKQAIPLAEPDFQQKITLHLQKMD